jgi:ABC-type phosphate transport system substrate-binding protein
MKKIISVLALASLAAAAHAEIVVVGNPSAGALTKDEVENIYTGKSQAFSPVDQSESAGIRADFYKKVTGKDLAQVKTLWAKLAFTGKGQPPKEVADAAAVKKAVSADAKAIGYIDKSEVDGSVKVLLSVN